jgi:hypothetical protein
LELSKFALPPWSSSAVKPTHTEVTSNLTSILKKERIERHPEEKSRRITYAIATSVIIAISRKLKRLSKQIFVLHMDNFTLCI